MSEVVLLSPHSPDRCVDLLRQAIDGGRPGASRQVAGRVSARAVRLCKRINYSNGFQTVLVGRLERRHEGAIFRGRAGMARVVRWGLIVLFSFAILVGGVLAGLALFALLGIAAPPVKGDPALALAHVLATLLGMAAVVRFGRWLARNEEQFLIDFVRRTLDAGPPTLDSPAESAISSGKATL